MLVNSQGYVYGTTDLQWIYNFLSNVDISLLYVLPNIIIKTEYTGLSYNHVQWMK
jgi:hypothetical protein